MRSLKLLLGSFVVYIVVAACSAASSPPTSAAAHDGGGGSSSSGASGGDSSGSERDSSGLDAIIDAITDPVSEASAAGGNTSGSRIKVQTVSGSDGSQVFAGLYDSSRKEQCNFRLASDGQLRCLPVSIVTIPTSYFSDALCSQPLGISQATCAPPSYVSKSVDPTCSSGGEHIYPVTVYAGSVYQPTGMGTCAMTNVSAAITLLAPGSEVAPTNFVSGTLQTGP